MRCRQQRRKQPDGRSSHFVAAAAEEVQPCESAAVELPKTGPAAVPLQKGESAAEELLLKDSVDSTAQLLLKSEPVTVAEEILAKAASVTGSVCIVPGADVVSAAVVAPALTIVGVWEYGSKGAKYKVALVESSVVFIEGSATSTLYVEGKGFEGQLNDEDGNLQGYIQLANTSVFDKLFLVSRFRKSLEVDWRLPMIASLVGASTQEATDASEQQMVTAASEQQEVTAASEQQNATAASEQQKAIILAEI